MAIVVIGNLLRPLIRYNFFDPFSKMGWDRNSNASANRARDAVKRNGFIVEACDEFHAMSRISQQMSSCDFDLIS